MRLLLIHGRFDPDESLDDWGFNGPDIEGVEALHVTYQQTFVLQFADRASCQKAAILTGWREWDELALEMTFHDDMLKTINVAADGPAMFFGDYEVQVQP